VVDTFRMSLLERELPLAALADYAKEARLGAGRLVLIAGEAGVGKSALVEQFERELPDVRCSWGACDGLFIPRPLGPLFDLAGQLGGDLLDLCRADASREAMFRALLRQIDVPGTLNWWSSRTSIGPMRRRWTCCGSLAADSTAPPFC